jgi:hypothetical protein
VFFKKQAIFNQQDAVRAVFYIQQGRIETEIPMPIDQRKVNLKSLQEESVRKAVRPLWAIGI